MDAESRDRLAHLVPPNWESWALASVTALENALQVEITKGLTSTEARLRLQFFGPNELRVDPPPVWRILLQTLTSRRAFLLLAISSLYGLFEARNFGDSFWAAALVAVILLLELRVRTHLNRAAGTVSRSLPIPVRVLRDQGNRQTISSTDLVPGDIVLLSAGQRAPVDGCIVAAFAMQVDESMFYLPSSPASVRLQPKVALGMDTAVADNAGKNAEIHSSFICEDTRIVAGKGAMMVTATGSATRVNRRIEPCSTWDTAQYGRGLCDFTPFSVERWRGAPGVFCGLLFAFSVVRGLPWNESLAISLAVAFVMDVEPLLLLPRRFLAVGAESALKHKIYFRSFDAVKRIGRVTRLVTDMAGILTANNPGVRCAIVFAAFPGREHSDARHTSGPTEESVGDILPHTEIYCRSYAPPDLRAGDALSELHALASCWALASDAFKTSGGVARSAEPANPYDDAAGKFFFGSPQQKTGSCLKEAATRCVTRYPIRVAEVPFDPVSKYSVMCAAKANSVLVCPRSLAASGAVSIPSDSVTVVAGAPESVIPLCDRVLMIDTAGSSSVALTDENRYQPFLDPDAAVVLEKASEQARLGGRVLAYAVKVKRSYAKQGRSLVSGPIRMSPSINQSGVCTAADSFAEDGSNRVSVTVIAASELRDLVLVGIIAYDDPVRTGVPAALNEFASLGVRVVVASDDHPETVAAFSKAMRSCFRNTLPTGSSLSVSSSQISARPTPAPPKPSTRVVPGKHIEQMDEAMLGEFAEEVDLFARVSPSHRCRLIEALQAKGHVVAFIGGMHDIEALRVADVGLAVLGGISSHRNMAVNEANVVVLDTDVNLVAQAIRQGRLVLLNIGKATNFWLSCKGGLAAAVGTAIVISANFPVKAMAFLLLEPLLHNGIAVVYNKEELEQFKSATDVTKHEGILQRTFVCLQAKQVIWASGLTAATCSISHLYAQSLSLPADCGITAGTTWWLTYLFNQIALGATFRTVSGPLLLAPINWMCVWWTFGLIAEAVFVEFAGLESMGLVFGLKPVGMQQWLLSVLLGMCSLVVLEVLKALSNCRQLPERDDREDRPLLR